MNTDQFPYAHQDIGYLLTAYADSQLAPDGVMWVEEQLDRNAELRSKLKEIRGLQAALRQAFAGNAPTYELDLPRRDALMEQAALAALAEKKKSNIISFKTAFRIAAAASVVLCVWAISMPNLLESRAPMMTKSSGDDLNDVDQEFPPMRVTTTAAPVQSDPLAAPPVQNGIAIAQEVQSQANLGRQMMEAQPMDLAIQNRQRKISLDIPALMKQLPIMAQ